jgi:hypothetical protein
MPSEAMMAIRGLVIGPLRPHQQAFLPQDVKQSVSPNLDARLGEFPLQHAVQLASAYTRLAQTYRLHKTHYCLCLVLALQRSLMALVICLAAYAHVAAGPLNA